MSDNGNDPLIGKVIDGYRILGVLGQGGMGIVYKAEDEELARIVALKMIFPSLARDETFVRRFRSEARALARIKSKYIVGVHALRKTDLGLFIVMECVNGGTVTDLLAGGPLPWQRAQPIIDQMLMAFGEAHEVGVIHRDIKPGNVMLTNDGVVKVTDFGLAKLFAGEGATMATVTQGIAGTLFYMSPEQVRGRSDLDHRSDLYSVGMTIYQMLAGRLYLERDSGEFEIMRNIVEVEPPPPSTFNPKIPAGLDAIVMKSLAKDPADRYQSAEEMRQAFLDFHRDPSGNGRVVTGGDGYGGPTVTGQKKVKDDKPGGGGVSKALLFGGVGVLIAILAIVGFIMLRPKPSGPPIGFPSDSLDLTPIDSLDGPRPFVETTTVVVAATPRDATIYVNGEEAVAGASIEVPPGAVSVRVEKPGYEPYTATRQVDTGEELLLPVALTRTASTQEPVADDDPPRELPEETSPDEVRTASIRLIAPQGGSVSAAGETRRGNGEFLLDEGRQSITFVHPTYGSWTTRVNVRAGQARQYQAYFEREYNVLAKDGDNPIMSAALFVDGKESGFAPKRITLGRGSHRVEVRKDGYQSAEGSVTVEPSLDQPEPQPLLIQMRKQ